jgi:formate-dependent nitrite reductase membrane component NrfD
VSSRLAAVGAVASPVLLIADLGRPRRFLAMLRLVKVTSPLSIGSWVLASYVPAALAGAVLDPEGPHHRIRRLANAAAGSSGAVVCTYTAVLFANTAIPVWHEARRQLPWLFAASSAVAAGASAAVVHVEGSSGRRARRLAVAGAVAELSANQWMRRSLGSLTVNYDEGAAAPWTKAAKWLTAGGLVATMAGRTGVVGRAGAAAMVAGSLCLRLAVFRAGFASARDPRHTVTASPTHGAAP